MKIRESTTLIRDGKRFKHTKSYSLLDDEGHTLKKFKHVNDVKAYIISLKEATHETN